MTSSTLPYLLRKAARTSSLNCTGTLHTVTRIRLFPGILVVARSILSKRYSQPIWLLGHQEVAEHPRSRSFTGSSTGLGFPLSCRALQSFLFLSPASLHNLSCVTMKDRVLCSVSATSSGRGNMMLALNFPTLSCSLSSSVFFFVTQDTGTLRLWGVFG